MKTFVRSAAICASLFLAFTVSAQDKMATPAATGSTVAARPMPAMMPLNIAKMTEEMKLTTDQVAKLKEVDAAAEKAKAGIASDAKPEDRNVKMREIMATRDKSVSGILTPEQMKTWNMSRRAAMRPQATTAPAAPAKPAEKK